jgi:hypothetical protein
MILLRCVDTETKMIGYPDQVIPDLIWYMTSEVFYDETTFEAKWDTFEYSIHTIADNNIAVAFKRDFLSVCYGDKAIFTNAAFDLKVLYKYFKKNEEMQHLILDALDSDNIHDTQMRMKLELLSTTGTLEHKGTSLAAQCVEYLDLDISEDKKSETRTSYEDIIDIPLERVRRDHPQYIEYGVKDITLPIKIFIEQEKRRQEEGYCSMNTEADQIRAAYVLDQAGGRGLKIDLKAVKKLKEEIDTELEEANVDAILEGAGLLSDTGSLKENELREYLKANHKRKIRMTKPTESFPKGQISLGKKNLALIEDDPVIDAILIRKGVSKNLTTYLPHISFPRVHPNFNVLVNSGRSSCRGKDEAEGSYSQFYEWGE